MALSITKRKSSLTTQADYERKKNVDFFEPYLTEREEEGIDFASPQTTQLRKDYQQQVADAFSTKRIEYGEKLKQQQTSLNNFVNETQNIAYDLANKTASVGDRRGNIEASSLFSDINTIKQTADGLNKYLELDYLDKNGFERFESESKKLDDILLKFNLEKTSGENIAWTKEKIQNILKTVKDDMGYENEQMGFVESMLNTFNKDKSFYGELNEQHRKEVAQDILGVMRAVPNYSEAIVRNIWDERKFDDILADVESIDKTDSWGERMVGQGLDMAFDIVASGILGYFSAGAGTFAYYQVLSESGQMAETGYADMRKALIDSVGETALQLLTLGGSRFVRMFKAGNKVGKPVVEKSALQAAQKLLGGMIKGGAEEATQEFLQDTAKYMVDYYDAENDEQKKAVFDDFKKYLTEGEAFDTAFLSFIMGAVGGAVGENRTVNVDNIDLLEKNSSGAITKNKPTFENVGITLPTKDETGKIIGRSVAEQAKEIRAGQRAQDVDTAVGSVYNSSVLGDLEKTYYNEVQIPLNTGITGVRMNGFVNPDGKFQARGSVIAEGQTIETESPTFDGISFDSLEDAVADIKTKLLQKTDGASKLNTQKPNTALELAKIAEKITKVDTAKVANQGRVIYKDELEANVAKIEKDESDIGLANKIENETIDLVGSEKVEKANLIYQRETNSKRNKFKTADKVDSFVADAKKRNETLQQRKDDIELARRTLPYLQKKLEITAGSEIKQDKPDLNKQVKRVFSEINNEIGVAKARKTVGTITKEQLQSERQGLSEKEQATFQSQEGQRNDMRAKIKEMSDDEMILNLENIDNLPADIDPAVFLSEVMERAITTGDYTLSQLWSIAVQNDYKKYSGSEAGQILSAYRNLAEISLNPVLLTDNLIAEKKAGAGISEEKEAEIRNKIKTQFAETKQTISQELKGEWNEIISQLTC